MCVCQCAEVASALLLMVCFKVLLTLVVGGVDDVSDLVIPTSLILDAVGSYCSYFYVENHFLSRLPHSTLYLFS